MKSQTAEHFQESREVGHALFWMENGTVHRIRLKHLSAFYQEALFNTGELSKGAKIVRDAVKTKNAGRMTELLAMVRGGNNE